MMDSKGLIWQGPVWFAAPVRSPGEGDWTNAARLCHKDWEMTASRIPLSEVRVRPLLHHERERWNGLMRRHH